MREPRAVAVAGKNAKESDKNSAKENVKLGAGGTVPTGVTGV